MLGGRLMAVPFRLCDDHIHSFVVVNAQEDVKGSRNQLPGRPGNNKVTSGFAGGNQEREP